MKWRARLRHLLHTNRAAVEVTRYSFALHSFLHESTNSVSADVVGGSILVNRDTACYTIVSRQGLTFFRSYPIGQGAHEWPLGDQLLTELLSLIPGLHGGGMLFSM